MKTGMAAVYSECVEHEASNRVTVKDLLVTVHRH
jgi:hypothetical protein